MGKSIITTAGAALIAQKQANAQVLTIDQIVFADIPDLDTSVPPSAETVMPAAENIKLQTAIDQTGLIDNTTVVYSKILGSAVGDFYLNWIGLYSSADDVLVAVCHTPRHLKYASDGQRLGNNLVKNFALEINNVSDLTGIVINAETWQWDFSEMFAGIDHNHDDTYEPLGAIVTHVAAIDPHPQYTNERGMVLSINDTDPLAVEMSLGKIADSSYTYMMTGIVNYRKKIDAVWTQGEGNGGRPVGVTLSPNALYTYFALFNPTTGVTDAGFDTSITAANLLADANVIAAGLTHYRYIGDALTNSDATKIIDVFQRNNIVYPNWHSYTTLSAATDYVAAVDGMIMISVNKAGDGLVDCYMTINGASVLIGRPGFYYTNSQPHCYIPIKAGDNYRYDIPGGTSLADFRFYEIKR